MSSSTLTINATKAPSSSLNRLAFQHLITSRSIFHRREMISVEHCWLAVHSTPPAAWRRVTCALLQARRHGVQRMKSSTSNPIGGGLPFFLPAISSGGRSPAVNGGGRQPPLPPPAAGCLHRIANEPSHVHRIERLELRDMVHHALDFPDHAFAVRQTRERRGACVLVSSERAFDACMLQQIALSACSIGAVRDVATDPAQPQRAIWDKLNPHHTALTIKNLRT